MDKKAPGYRSATEYRFREDQIDAIVRTAAYHRKDYPRSAIWFPPHEHDGIRGSMTTSFWRTSDAGLGSLDRLPLELLHDVLLRLDMHSIFKFRQTNLGSRRLVNSLKQYQLVASHGLDLFCALLRTKLTLRVSLSDFYDTLCTKDCWLCHKFGSFISLLTWDRCCFSCVKYSRNNQVHTRAAVQKKLGLTKAQVDQLSSLKSLPGAYTLYETVLKSRVTLVPAHLAILASGQPYDLANELLGLLRVEKHKFNFMGSCALPYYNRRAGRVEHGLSCAGCQLATEKKIISSSDRDMEYAQDDFLEHFRWCEQAQLLWRSSGEGNHVPSELSAAVRRGGWFKD
ncbi:hypothetical protein F5Y14DRAFT_464389 [Nemania sp. NC0429]|nr:hypothetical protein F5Y14DRAFT_464389 [Nemania sp. NC0429]